MGSTGFPSALIFTLRITDAYASLQAPKGIIRIKTAREKAARLALQFLDAIQSPRLNMNDGDDLRGTAHLDFFRVLQDLSASRAQAQIPFCTHNLRRCALRFVKTNS